MLHSSTDQQSKAVGPLLSAVKEYNTLKQIFDDNSEVILVGRQRVKAVDLKVLSTLFEDAHRQRQVAKIKDDNYIFMRRAVDVAGRYEQVQREQQRAQMGAEVSLHVDQIKTSVDFERHKVEASKLNKHIVRKLIHAQTKRMLKIIGYSSTEQDRKRLEYGIYQYGYNQNQQPAMLRQISLTRRNRSSHAAVK